MSQTILSAEDLLLSIKEKFGEVGESMSNLIREKCMLKVKEKKEKKEKKPRPETGYIKFCKWKREEIKKERENSTNPGEKLTLGKMILEQKTN